MHATVIERVFCTTHSFHFTLYITLRCQIHIPLFITFSIFSNLLDVIRTPPIYWSYGDLLLYESLFSFIFFRSTIYRNFSFKLASLCMHFSFMLCDSPFFFFPSLYKYFQPFFNFSPPSFLLTPGIYQLSEFLLTPPFIMTLLVYLALDSSYCHMLSLHTCIYSTLLYSILLSRLVQTSFC